MTFRRILDLSHPIHAEMLTHPGIPGPIIRPFRTRKEMASHYAPEVSFELTYVALVTSIGTYLDAPAHRYADGADLASVPLERSTDLPGLVINSSAMAIGPDAFAGLDVAGRAVLVYTGWDRRWNTPAYWEPSPFLTANACHLLVDGGATLVGVDFGNVDNREDLARPAHSILLAAGLGVVENLRGLESLPREDFRFHAAPIAIRGGAAFPVRAYAIVEG